MLGLEVRRLAAQVGAEGGIDLHPVVGMHDRGPATLGRLDLGGRVAGHFIPTALQHDPARVEIELPGREAADIEQLVVSAGHATRAVLGSQRSTGDDQDQHRAAAIANVIVIGMTAEVPM
ncbi:MAG: hypothetical protein R3E48_02330 [Burkholderiaceae bacterium]